MSKQTCEPQLNQTIDCEELSRHFRPPAFPGSYFISFEGIEGAGKSTQIALLNQYLEQNGHRVLVLREPGGTSFGEKLRSAILNAGQEIHPLAEAHLFASSRTQLLHEVTLKELEEPGTIIIYDRYIDSSIAYQGVARKLGIAPVLKIHQSFPLNLVPHLTFYLKIPLALSIERQKERNLPQDYFESKGKIFYQDLINGYESAAQLFPNRILSIEGTRDQEAVFSDIKSHIDQLLGQRNDILKD